MKTTTIISSLAAMIILLSTSIPSGYAAQRTLIPKNTMERGTIERMEKQAPKRKLRKAAEKPDLTIEDLRPNKKQIFTGDEVTLSATISHTGTQPLHGVVVHFSVDNKPVGKDTIRGIKPGTTEQAQITFQAGPPGRHCIKAVVNPHHTIAETNPRNNTREDTITIAPIRQVKLPPKTRSIEAKKGTSVRTVTPLKPPTKPGEKAKETRTLPTLKPEKPRSSIAGVQRTPPQPSTLSVLPRITSVKPDTLIPGKTQDLTIRGSNLDEKMLLNLGRDIQVKSVTVSPLKTTASLVVYVEKTARPGLRSVEVDHKRQLARVTVEKPSILVHKKLPGESKLIKTGKIAQDRTIGKKDKELGLKHGSVKMSAKGKLPERRVPEPVPLLDDSGGIRITSPRSGHVWHTGTAVTVSYRIKEDPPSGPVTFSLFNRDVNRVVAEKTHEYRRSFGDISGTGTVSPSVDESFMWNLPDLLRGSRYYLKAAGCGFKGISDTFTVENIADLAGMASGIEVLKPRWGERFRPGGSMTVRYRFTDPDAPRPDYVSIALTYSNLMPISDRPAARFSPETAETDITLDIPEDLEDRTNGYVIRISASPSEGTEARVAVSRAFTISSATTFGEAEVADIPAEARLQVLSPGMGGEYWRAGSEHAIRWRFFAGGDTIPGTWLVTLLKYNPSWGYRIDRSFTPAACEVSEVSQAGLTWLEHSTLWTVPEDIIEEGDYKIRVSGLSYTDDGSFNFTIVQESAAVDLSIPSLSSDLHNLIANIRSDGGFHGAVEFMVERLTEDGRPISSRRVTVSIPAGGGPVTLGSLEDLGADLSHSDCGAYFRVTIDSDNRVDETDEDHNTKYQRVYPPVRIGKAYVTDPFGNVLGDGSTVRARAGSRVFCCALRNCGSFPASGSVRIRQKGYWIAADSRRLEPEYHDEMILEEYRDFDTLNRIGGFCLYAPPVHYGDHPLLPEDSDIEISFEGDFEEWSDPPVITLHLDIID